MSPTKSDKIVLAVAALCVPLGTAIGFNRGGPVVAVMAFVGFGVQLYFRASIYKLRFGR
jgi:hypothetical protein